MKVSIFISASAILGWEKNLPQVWTPSINKMSMQSYILSSFTFALPVEVYSCGTLWFALLPLLVAINFLMYHHFLSLLLLIFVEHRQSNNSSRFFHLYSLDFIFLDSSLWSQMDRSYLSLRTHASVPLVEQITSSCV